MSLVAAATCCWVLGPPLGITVRPTSIRLAVADEHFPFTPLVRATTCPSNLPFTSLLMRLGGTDTVWHLQSRP